MNKKTRHNYGFKKSHTLNKTKSKQNDMQSMLLSIDNNNSQTGGANPPSTWFRNIFGFDENLMFTVNNTTKMPTNLENYFTIKTETIDANDTSTKDNYLSSLSALFSSSSSSDAIKVTVQKHTLICSAKNAPPGFKEQYIGMFDRPTLAQLEQCINSEKYAKDFEKLKGVNIKDKKKGGLSFKHIVTQDVALLHCDPKNEGAIFQVASQFNCLEMKSEAATPNLGVTIYSDDHTQGPACAMACPAALVYRNYFVEHTKNGVIYKGQCARQIDNLEDIGDLLGNMNETYWTMRNGYVIVDNHEKLGDISNQILKVVGRKNIIQALRLGVHWSTSVVDNQKIATKKKPLNHRVCQVYASALPVSRIYNPSITNIDLWAPFATCILEGSYMATLCIAALIAIKAQTRVKCYLTLIGGGVFGNKPNWIIDAITKALEKYKDYPIDVMLVHYQMIDPAYSEQLKTIGEIITDLPEKCGSKKFDIATFLHPIPYANKTIKEITLPNTSNKMKLYAIQGSLVDFEGDVIVNAANEACLGGDGIDGAIGTKGGNLLYKARNALPPIRKDVRCPTGEAKTTIGGDLNTCLCIHAVGPNYNSYVKNKWTEADLLLYSAYFNSMKEAYDHGCTNIAFSLLSSGIFRGKGNKDKDRGLKNVISIGILAVVNFAIALGHVVDVFFYAYNKSEYDILAELINKYNIDHVNGWKNFASNITDFNTDYLTTKFIDKNPLNPTNTNPKYENLQSAYDALAIKAGLGPGSGPGDAALGDAAATQQEIFTKFETYLESYKPPSILDYKQFGQFIVEDRQVIDNITQKTDYVRTKRVEILVNTLKLFGTKTPDYYKSAKKNMLNWCKKVRPRDKKGLEVIVEPIDWGEMALKCTKKYGSIFACLNMANSKNPGGGYQTGAAAQEENMFRRTNCHFSINRDSMLNPNKDKSYYFYKPHMQDLIGAKDGENTYIDVENPRICIKDKETYNGVNTPEGTQNIGYKQYDASNIFLFYELRCAAVNIRNPTQFNEAEMRKIIHAQFKTLKDKGLRHAILGAFGCGAFNNPPLKVAALYKECLIQYKDDFDVIAFPIYFAGNGPENYASFREILLNNPTDKQSIQSIFYNGKTNGAEAEAEASESNEVVTPTPTPLTANAAAIAAAINTGAIKKNTSKKDHIKAGTGKAGTGKAGTGKAATVLAAKPAKAETDEEKAAKAGADEAGTDEAETDEAATHEVVKSGSQENDLRQAGRKDLAHSGSADNGSVNGNGSDENNGTPSQSFDISPEGSNGQGMLIGFLILCTLGIGAVSFIK
jgi:O-acetyl-ADP-ribose deacetylase (regulator of RNase III)